MRERAKPSIVVGIDGSTQSLAALRWALREGVRSDSPVEVVHCWQPQTLTDLALAPRHTFARASLCMLDNEIAAALSEMDVKPDVKPVSIHGRPAASLRRCSDGAAMLVLGSHRYTDLKDVVFGQIARSCLKHAACPVVVVGTDGIAERQHPKVPVTASS